MVKPLKNLNIKAILIGWVVDVVGTLIAILVIGLIAGIIFTAQGLAEEEIVDQFNKSPSIQLVSLLIGFLITAFAGYMTAFIAKREEIKHALVFGLLSLLTGVLMIFVFPQPIPAWSLILGIVIIVPAALIGGYVRLNTKGAR